MFPDHKPGDPRATSMETNDNTAIQPAGTKMAIGPWYNLVYLMDLDNSARLYDREAEKGNKLWQVYEPGEGLGGGCRPPP